MSRSDNSHKGSGYEMWSRRPRSGESNTSENKKICHGIERARSKQEIVREMEDLDFSFADGCVWLRGGGGIYFRPTGVDIMDTIDMSNDERSAWTESRLLCYNLLLHGY